MLALLHFTDANLAIPVVWITAVGTIVSLQLISRLHLRFLAKTRHGLVYTFVTTP